MSRPRALVVRGEPGVGKTALLEYLVEHASGCRVVRATGVQSEMELAFAGVHQLLTPMLDRLQRLPARQRAALRSAFGLGPGSVPDRFLVGLAVLGLLADAAGEHPLLCLVDDQQWLDHASAQVLGFVARRLAAEPVALVFATRVPGEELAGLPELVVEGLGEAGPARRPGQRQAGVARRPAGVSVGAPPGHDWPVALATGGCERRPAPTRLVEPCARCETAQNNGSVTEPRLYQIVRQPGPVGERTFEITFLDPGVQAYAFTFG